ncbi:hypothetical protein C823_007442 [Eubacterium plexicaudatum ASF492]|nr:hypothetical protein C823_007442 [Eubacterium plexicaudatum ASF492]
MKLLLIAVIVLLIRTGILSARHGCYKKQMNHLLQQLELTLEDETNILFTSSVNIDRTQEVIHTLNRLMEQNRHINESCVGKTAAIGKALQAFPTISARLLLPPKDICKCCAAKTYRHKNSRTMPKSYCSVFIHCPICSTSCFSTHA